MVLAFGSVHWSAGWWWGGRDGLVQDPTLKCLKSIHTEPRGVQWGEGGNEWAREERREGARGGKEVKEWEERKRDREVD